MAATYNPALTDPISRVRQKIGDTGWGRADWTQPAEFEDETILFYLQNEATELGAARRLAWDLVARYAQMVDINVDEQLTRASQRHKQYELLAKRLDAEWAQANAGQQAATPTYMGPMVTGIGDCRTALDDPCAPEPPIPSRYW